MRRLLPSVATSVALVFGACVHTPPGTSVEVALARKAELVRLATPPQTPVAIHGGAPRGAAGAGGNIGVVEPPLPTDKDSEKLADAFSRAMFCLNVGKDDEAIAAFEEAVSIDPGFQDAWQHLASLYEKNGASEKAIEAFRRAKTVARK